MFKKLFAFAVFVLLGTIANAQSSYGRIFQPGSDGPYFEYAIEQGKPKEYYDAGGPDKGMRGNLVYTLLRLKPVNSDSHITIVFNEMDIDDYDELRIYDGLIELNNEANEDGEYEYGWPKNIEPNTTIKGNPSAMPVVVKSEAADGALSVAFYCFSDKPGWSGMIYCVKNGDPEPGTAEVFPNFTFRVDPNIVLEEDEDGEEEELFVNFELKGVQANQVIQIEDGYGKRDYTISNNTIGRVTLDVSPGDYIKIYGDLSMLNGSANKFTKAEIGKNEKLEVLNLGQNKITEVDLTRLPELRELWITGNKITSIDISNLPKLEEFYGSYNNVGALRTTMNTELSVLSCVEMGLTELNLSNNPKLEILTASSNAFEAVPDLTKTPLIRSLDLENTGISSIDLSMLPKLKKLDLSNNRLETIDLTNNLLLTTIDLDYNKFNACAMNDVMFMLPQRTESDEAILRMANNEGAATCDNTLLEGMNWSVNFTGDGTGCETAKLRFESSEYGTISTIVDGENVPELTPITKGREVKVQASPINGYNLDKVLLDGIEVSNNTFNISKYGVLAAVFTKVSGIDDVNASGINVIMEGENVIVSGLVASETFRIIDLSGKLLYTGITDSNGFASVNLPANKTVLVNQRNIVIKIMR
ncbi:MAG: leucine-rich repeat domain-containing protein [Prevotella sp.]|uniref:leucine-rich repeat domain-containing protein n=1 Tax=Prevotella sp. TaxID=59823 RepID=UPI002A2E36F8|nr:leucine-rich repeat domain-containing protein [Prevotella sp.]MDD7318061.1 leucine-rich repeat domain-containing protein [Prevotellaceae bacterium]MDY4021050.1 leucine-rich repeat domain-containing protein [Prevotella sp.]